jgi:hypothetical protein
MFASSNELHNSVCVSEKPRLDTPVLLFRDENTSVDHTTSDSKVDAFRIRTKKLGRYFDKQLDAGCVLHAPRQSMRITRCSCLTGYFAWINGAYIGRSRREGYAGSAIQIFWKPFSNPSKPSFQLILSWSTRSILWEWLLPPNERTQCRLESQRPLTDNGMATYAPTITIVPTTNALIAIRNQSGRESKRWCRRGVLVRALFAALQRQRFVNAQGG